MTTPNPAAAARQIAQDAVVPVSLMLSPQTPIETAIAQMNRLCSSYVLVTEQRQPVGIFTERNLVQRVAAGKPITGLPLSAVMTLGIVTLSATNITEDAFALLQQMKTAQLHHLPVVDSEEQVVGIITQNSILQALQATDRRKTIALLQQKNEQLRSEKAAIAKKQDKSIHQRQHIESDRDQAQTDLQSAYAELEQKHQDLTQTYERLSSTLIELRTTEQLLITRNIALDQMRQEAENERARYQGLFELAPSGYLVTDLAGTILESNQAAAHLLCPGRASDTLIDFSLIAFFDSSERPLFRQHLSQIQKSYRNTSFEIHFTPFHASQSFPAMVTTGSITDAHYQLSGIRWIIRDITALKEAEAALRQVNLTLESRVETRTAELNHSERRWRTLLETVQLAVVGLDCQERVTYANPYLLALLGYPASEVIGQLWFERFVPSLEGREPALFLAQAFKQQFCQPEMPLLNHNGVRTKSGEIRIIAWNNTPLYNSRGEITGVMSIGEDITERSAIERMKDEFISVVSHELRTPLTAIYGGLKMLESGMVAADSAQGQQLLTVAADSSQRLTRLVNDILTIDRMESGKAPLRKQRLQTREISDSILSAFELKAQKASIELMANDPNIEMVGDGDRLHQVLTNLIDNALKFSPTGSTIQLQVEPTTASFEQAPASSAVRFSVQDQGAGIPTDQHARIFERFIQADSSDTREQGGTGLGLSICRAIVEQHGGRIWIESEPGKGSRFCFELPTEPVD